MGKIGSLIWLLLPGLAQAGTLVGSLDKTMGSVYDRFMLTITASGSSFGDPPAPPDVAGLSIQLVNQSSQFYMINGQTSRELELLYEIAPSQEGEFTIPSFEMEVDDEPLKTLPLAIKVTPAKGALPGENPEIFVERDLSKSSVYVGEPFLSKVLIHTRVSMSQPRGQGSHPKEFKQIAIKGERSFRKNLGAQTYDVIELAEILIPTQAGTFAMEPYRLEALIPDPRAGQNQRRDPFPFFNRTSRVRKVVVSPQKQIVVKPLPTKGRPSDYSGLVGQFRLSKSLTSDSPRVGDTTTLTLIVEGEGTVKGMKDPDLAFDQRLKIYKDKPIAEEQVDRDRGVFAKKTFKYALVPTSPGEVDLGVARLSVFNPLKHTYETLEVTLGTIMVKGKKAQPAASVAEGGDEVKKQQVKELSQDVFDIKRTLSSGRGDTLSLLDYGLLSAPPLVGFCFLLGGGGYRFGRRSQKARASLRRRLDAKRKLKALLARFRTQTIPSEDDLQALYQGLKEYLGAFYEAPGLSLTAKEIGELLAQSPLDQELVKKAVSGFQSLEASLYGGVPPEHIDPKELGLVWEQVSQGLENAR